MTVNHASPSGYALVVGRFTVINPVHSNTYIYNYIIIVFLVQQNPAYTPAL